MFFILIDKHKGGFGDFLLNTTPYFWNSLNWPGQRKTVTCKNPFAWFISKNGSQTVHGLDLDLSFDAPIEALRKTFYFLKATRSDSNWIGAGYFGFDLCRQLETSIATNVVDDLATPDIFFAFYDHFNLDVGKGALASGTPTGSKENADFVGGKPRKSFSKKDYINAVRQAIEHIRSGDIFQVNLSQRFDISCQLTGVELFNRLQLLSPAPYSGYMDCGAFKIVSSSPESFISLENGLVRTRPIKGTRKRSDNKSEDERFARELLSSSKDRAENVMIVDVERNDLSRVCKFDSVKTEELCKLESFSNVHHLVSTVTGELKPGKDIFDLLEAAFPSGSISGAPKIRSMEIIYQLERFNRGPYTGSLGYIDASGNAEFNILIRTIILKNMIAYFQAGGGIVADSDPVLEYEETLHKASRMFQALGLDINETLYL